MATLKFWNWFKKKEDKEEYNSGAESKPPKPPKPAKPEKFGKSYPVSGVMMEVFKGASRLSKVHKEEGEYIWPNRKEEIYNGVSPQVVEINRSIVPSRLRWLLKKTWRVRLYSRIGYEQFTRDPYDGSYLDREKKRSVLIERNIIDSEGYLLDQKPPDEDGKVTFTRSNRKIIDGCHVKVDVSDIDFIKQEWHAHEQSKNTRKMADGMAKTGKQDDNIQLYITLAFIVLTGLIVFMFTGGAEGWF